MKILQQFLFIIAASIIFLSCKKNTTDDNNGNTTTAQTTLNVSYGTDALQKMDVYLPANRSKDSTKVIIMIHGGGWTGGDKNDYLNFAGFNFVDTLKKRLPNYAIFNINYRLSANGNTNIFPTQENDVKEALQFIFNKSTDYKISNKYVLIGASAGGHLSLLQSYKYNTPVKPKAIVSFFGPSDLIQMYNNPVNGITLISQIFAQAIGKTPVQDSLLYANSSPTNFINNTSPPTILFHGSADPLVSPVQSQLVKNKLEALGITSSYTLYPNIGHGDWSGAIYGDAFNKMKIFLDINVQ